MILPVPWKRIVDNVYRIEFKLFEIKGLRCFQNLQSDRQCALIRVLGSKKSKPEISLRLTLFPGASFKNILDFHHSSDICSRIRFAPLHDRNSDRMAHPAGNVRSHRLGNESHDGHLRSHCYGLRHYRFREHAEQGILLLRVRLLLREAVREQVY